MGLSGVIPYENTFDLPVKIHPSVPCGDDGVLDRSTVEKNMGCLSRDVYPNQ